jgi:Flp pilus assembly protein TadG
MSIFREFVPKMTHFHDKARHLDVVTGARLTRIEVLRSTSMSRSRSRSERGAIIIQVAIALLGLTIFSAIVLDYGVLWASRGQAQNSADAGALAAAINLRDNPTNTTLAVSAARKFANLNSVWGESPLTADVLVQTGLTCPPGTGGGTGCVRVQVNRGGVDRNGTAHTNTLPTFFANLAGITSQAISATAMAQVSAGNSVQCIKPWIVADKWTDTTPDTDVAPYAGDSWDRDDNFLPGTDSYNPSNGFNPTQHSGYEMPLKPGALGPGNVWSSGWAMEIDFGTSGSAAYKDTIRGCPNYVPTVGIFNPSGYAAAHPGETCNASGDTPDPQRGCISVKTGMSQGPTSQGVADLVGLDSGARWISPSDPGYDPTKDDPDNLGYVNSPCMNSGTCVDWDGNSVSLSPRIVPIAVFDTTAFINESCSGGTQCVTRVVNLAGFFIEGMCGDPVLFATPPTWCGSQPNKVVIGRFMRYPGQLSGSGGPTVSSFAQAVRLVR